MKKNHRFREYFFLLVTCILLISLVLPGCGKDSSLAIPPPPDIPDIPAGTAHGWQADYTEIYFNDFESSPELGLNLSNAELTGEAIDGQQAVKLSGWQSIDTDPGTLPLSPDTYYTFEFDYRILNRGTGDNILVGIFYPEGSSAVEDTIHSLPMLSNAEAESTFSSGALTTGTFDAYYLKIQAGEGVSIIIDNLRIYRLDPLPVTEPLERWIALEELPYPRLGNYIVGGMHYLAMAGGGVVPDWPEGEPVYQTEELVERLALYDVVVGSYIGNQTADSAFIQRLRRINPAIVVLPYNIPHELGSNVPRPPFATIDPHFTFFDGVADEWIVTDTGGNRVVDANYPDIWKMNFSEHCPVVEDRTYTDYLIDALINDQIASGFWDGIFFDNLFARVNPHIKNVGDPSLFDYDINRNGVRDETPAMVSEMARSSTLELLQRLRTKLGDNALIMGNNGFSPDLCTAPYINGYTFENWNVPWLGMGEDHRLQPNEGAWRRSLYDYYLALENTKAPHIIILQGAGQEVGTAVSAGEVNRNYLEATERDIARHRFSLGTALLGDGFYEYDLYDNVSAPYWFDEFSVDENGVAVEGLQYKGYLGLPLGNAREFKTPATPVWEESFASGSLPSTLQGEGRVEDGRLVMNNPDYTQRRTMTVETVPARVPLDSGNTYVIQFDWEILETFNFDFQVIVSGTAGHLGGYRLPEVIKGESGSVSFPVTLNHGSSFKLEFVMTNGGKIAIDNIKIYEGGAGPWRRDFENGFVLVNPLNKPYTYSADELSGEFNRTGIKRILGTQAPEVNNGQPVTGSLTLQPFDAIILLADSISRN